MRVHHLPPGLADSLIRFGLFAARQLHGPQQALHHDLTTAGALALLIFFAFAMQCMSAMAVVRRETGGWKWPAIQFAYMSGLAYVRAFITYHLVSLIH